MTVQGPDFDDPDDHQRRPTSWCRLGAVGEGDARFEAAGLTVMMEDGQAVLEEPFPGTPFFESLGKAYDFYGDQPVEISHALLPKDRLPKEIFYIPAVVLLALVIWLQRRRRAKAGGLSCYRIDRA